MVRSFIILIVRIYRCLFSILFPPSCRFTPTCSQYAIDALNNNNVCLAVWMIIKRILKCHPFSNVKDTI